MLILLKYIRKCCRLIFLIFYLVVNFSFCLNNQPFSLITPREYTAQFNLASSNLISEKNIKDSSNLELDYCNNCDMYIGGLFPVHAPKYMRQTNENDKQSKNNFTSIKLDEFYYLSNINCGEIKKERGIQRLEAMLYAIDLINNSTNLLPHIKLGAKIYDTCDRDTIALEKCLNFVNDYFLLNNENIVNDFSCENEKAFKRHNGHQNYSLVPKKKYDVIFKRKVIGVIGAASSSVSIQVANLLRLFKVPQISYASTSPELSNKERFPFFSRVLPSDTLQAEAMTSVVNSFDWNYIATINEEGNLGGIDTLKLLAKKRNICISSSYTLSQTASEDDVKQILKDMFKQRARAVVVFLQDHNIRKILEIVINLNMTGHFYWIASDSWGTKKESINSNDLAAEGAITFSPKSYEIKEFNEYFKNLKPNTNMRNPWFKEFWEEQFNCTMNSNTPYSNQAKLSKRLCTGIEKLNFSADGFIHFVIDSVFAMAHAIQDLLQKNCANSTGKNLINCHLKTVFDGPELLKAIRNVEFTSVYGRKVKFTKDKENEGDGLAPLEVFQYQQYEPGKFGYRHIAEWEKDKPFSLNVNKLKWHDGSTKVPRSVCKEDCLKGEIKQGDDCCWVCVKCEENEFVAESGKQCIRCEVGYGPDETKTKCIKLKIEYMSLNSPLSLIPIIFSSIGFIVTLCCIFVFIRYNETPIIKASGRELCYVLLAGIMSCYLVTFPLVTKPTLISCILTRFGVSLSLTICLSALFTKTNRLSRIFNNSVKQVRQASYVSPQSQLVICFSIISVQLIGILVWTIASPPDIEFDYDDVTRVILQCKTRDSELGISVAYIVFLVILCTIYAIKTRKIPENFNEARFIGFTMYSICIIFIASITIYFGTTAATGAIKTPKNNYKIQLTTIALCLSLSATVILCCLFLPKLRVVLLKPSKNVRSKNNAKSKSVLNKQMSSVKTINSTNDTFKRDRLVNANAENNSTTSPYSQGIDDKVVEFNAPTAQNGTIENDIKPRKLSLKNENSLSYENIELTTNTEENSTSNNTSNLNAAIMKTPLLKTPNTIKQDNDSAQILFKRKSSRSTDENPAAAQTVFIPNDSECIKKQTTPPSESYYYLVKPRLLPNSNSFKDEPFVKNNSSSNQLKLNYQEQKNFSFEPDEKSSHLKIEDLEFKNNVKNLLDNKNDKSINNKKVCVIDKNNNNLNFTNANINRNTSISSYSSSIDNQLEFNHHHYLKNNHLVIDKRSSIGSSESISNSLNYTRKKETLVEKKTHIDEESSSAANTFLLNGEALNDLNDFYSLKITFV